MRHRVALLAGALLLSACSRDPEPPGALSPEDEQQLNEAAEMLDANAVSINAVEGEETLGND